MSFLYDMTPPVGDVSRVRWHLGDTEESVAIFSDEEIAFAISEAGGWQVAVVACIRSVLARLAAEPDMTADWLSVNWRQSSEAWERLLAEKKAEFGGGARANTGGQHTWRPDTLQKVPPDYA